MEGGRETQTQRKMPSFFSVFFSQHGESPLHIAAGYGRLKIVQLLRSHGATTDIKDKVRFKQNNYINMSLLFRFSFWSPR